MTKTFHRIAIAAVITAMIAPLVMAAAQQMTKKPYTTATQPPTDTIATPADSLLNETPLFDRLYLDAVCRQMNDDDSTALVLLERCKALKPDAAEVYHSMSLAYANMGKDSLAVESMLRAAALQPANDTYQENVAETYIQSRQYDRAIAAYEQLYAHHHDRNDVLNILVGLYGTKNDYGKMLSTIDRMEQADGPSEELSFMRMNIYEAQGDRKNAYRILKSLADDHPNEPNYKVMLGNWLMQHERQAEAYKLFTSALKEDKQNEFALNSLYDYYRTTGDTAAAVRLRDDLLLNTQTDVKTKMSILQQAVRENEQDNVDSTLTLGLIDRTIAATPKKTTLYALKIGYIQFKNMPSDSTMAVCAEALANEPDNTDIRSTLVSMMWKEEKWDDLEKTSLDGTLYNPDCITFYYTLGIARIQKDDKAGAIDALKRGVGEANDKSDHDMVSEMYGAMGDLLFNTGKKEEAFESYDNSLKWKADNNTVLNNYAYYLSTEGRDLDRAAEMSLKTIKADPTNATCLDTYAWILFLQKRYDEAKAYIDLTLENATKPDGPGHVELEHAGDIYLSTGDTEKAVDFWRKAIEAGGDKNSLDKKIKTRKL